MILKKNVSNITTEWNCIVDASQVPQSLKSDCTDNKFIGNFALGVASTGTYTVVVKNESSNPVPAQFNASDLDFSNSLVQGLSVAGVSASPDPALTNNEIPGLSTVIVTYQVSGTPSGNGNITGVWKNGTLACTDISFDLGTATNPPNALEPSCNSIAFSPFTDITGTDNVSATFKVTVANKLTTAANFTFSADDLIIDNLYGLSVSVSPASTPIAGNGNVDVIYTISGTPTGNGGDMEVKWQRGTEQNNCAPKIQNVPAPKGLTADCGTATFAGNFIASVLSEGTVTVKITNASANALPANFATTDLNFSNSPVGGIGVAEVSYNPPLSSNMIAPGATVDVIYKVTGTPDVNGNITAAWSNGTLPCPAISIAVGVPTNPAGALEPSDCNLIDFSTFTDVTDTDNVSATFKVTLKNTLTTSADFTFSTADLDIKPELYGLTVAVSPASATIVGNGTEEITYTISGTPSGAGTMSVQWLRDGKGSACPAITQTVPAPKGLIADCASTEFTGTFEPGVAINATYKVKITNNSVQATTVNFSNADLSFFIDGQPLSLTVSAISQ